VQTVPQGVRDELGGDQRDVVTDPMGLPAAENLLYEGSSFADGAEIRR
jgi:hypothetical protein